MKPESRRLGVSTPPLQLLRMLLSDETNDDGERRIYFTQAASVTSFFTDDGEGGVRAHVFAGEFACPWTTTQEKLDAVEAAMLEETARRLNIRPDQVCQVSLNDIGQVADPHLKHRHTWAGRTKTRSRVGR